MNISTQEMKDLEYKLELQESHLSRLREQIKKQRTMQEQIDLEINDLQKSLQESCI